MFWAFLKSIHCSKIGNFWFESIEFVGLCYESYVRSSSVFYILDEDYWSLLFLSCLDGRPTDWFDEISSPMFASYYIAWARSLKAASKWKACSWPTSSIFNGISWNAKWIPKWCIAYFASMLASSLNSYSNKFANCCVFFYHLFTPLFFVFLNWFFYNGWLLIDAARLFAISKQCLGS